MSLDPSSDLDAMVLHLLARRCSRRSISRETGLPMCRVHELVRRLTGEPVRTGPYHDWTEAEKLAALALRKQGKTNTEIAHALGLSRKQVANQLDKSGAPTLDDALKALQRKPPRRGSRRVPCASSFAVAAVLGTEGRGWGSFCEEEE